MQKRMRGFMTASGAAVLATLAVSFVPAQGAPDGYTASLLPNPTNAPYIYANQINDSGRIVGGQEQFDGDLGRWTQLGVLWASATSDPTVLEPLDGYGDSWAADCNNRGQVCGHSVDWGTAPAPRRATIWDGQGNVTDAHPTGLGTWSSLLAINQYGDAVGFTLEPYGWYYATPFVRWADGDCEALDLDTDAYAQAWATGINKDGVVSGFAREITPAGLGNIHAAYWDVEGDFHDLHDDMESDLGTTVFASRCWGATDDGEIPGLAIVTWSSSAGATDARPFVWTPEDGFDWIDADGADAAEVGGGSHRYLVGILDGEYDYWGFYGTTACLWVRGNDGGSVVWDLEVIPMLDGVTAMTTYGVNTSGRAVGAAADASGYWYAWYADD